MRVTVEHRLPHSADRVFAVLSDPARRPEWQENTSDVRIEGPLPVAVGTRWTEEQRGVGHVEAEVTELEPGRRYAERGDTSSGKAQVTVTFAPDGDDATLLTMEVELNLRGLKKAFEPALGPMVRAQLPKDLERLGAILDGEAG
ncbi:MAG TPA: SRPBCC family protein [Miltoncostaeaceae bacterium]|nr:SRPBCC family protein [Miltoncostaeaceae bacterium]